MTFFDIIFIIISCLWVLSEIILNSVKKTNDSKKEEISFKLIFLVLIIGVSLGVFIYVFSKVYGIKWLYTTNIIIRNSGLVFILGGLFIRWSAILTLKQYFTVNVTIKDDHKIIKKGLYKFIRHPAYTGALVSYLGLGLAFGNWLSFVIIFTSAAIIFFFRIRAEEKVLLEHFGSEYENYKKETKYLIPFIL